MELNVDKRQIIKLEETRTAIKWNGFSSSKKPKPKPKTKGRRRVGREKGNLDN